MTIPQTMRAAILVEQRKPLVVADVEMEHEADRLTAHRAGADVAFREVAQEPVRSHGILETENDDVGLHRQHLLHEGEPAQVGSHAPCPGVVVGEAGHVVV